MNKTERPRSEVLPKKGRTKLIREVAGLPVEGPKFDNLREAVAYKVGERSVRNAVDKRVNIKDALLNANRRDGSARQEYIKETTRVLHGPRRRGDAVRLDPVQVKDVIANRGRRKIHVVAAMGAAAAITVSVAAPHARRDIDQALDSTNQPGLPSPQDKSDTSLMQPLEHLSHPSEVHVTIHHHSSEGTTSSVPYKTPEPSTLPKNGS